MPRIYEKTIRLEDDGYRLELELLVAALDNGHLLDSSALYTAVDGSRVGEIKRHGTYRLEGTHDPFACRVPTDIIFAYTAEQIRADIQEGEEGIMEYLDNYERPAIVVWDRAQFRPIETGELKEYQYQFIHPEKKQEAIQKILHVQKPQFEA